MTQPRRILWLAVFGATLSLLGVPAALRAQNYVTPTVGRTPPGNLIGVNVNNTAGTYHVDTHVSGDLVTYDDFGAPGWCDPRYNYCVLAFQVHYFDLATNSDASIPNNNHYGGTAPLTDYISDVDGGRIVFTQNAGGIDCGSWCNRTAIFVYDTGTNTATELDPLPDFTYRSNPSIGGSTVAWYYPNYYTCSFTCLPAPHLVPSHLPTLPKTLLPTT